MPPLSTPLMKTLFQQAHAQGISLDTSLLEIFQQLAGQVPTPGPLSLEQTRQALQDLKTQWLQRRQHPWPLEDDDLKHDAVLIKKSPLFNAALNHDVPAMVNFLEWGASTQVRPEQPIVLLPLAFQSCLLTQSSNPKNDPATVAAHMIQLLQDLARAGCPSDDLPSCAKVWLVEYINRRRQPWSVAGPVLEVLVDQGLSPYDLGPLMPADLDASVRSGIAMLCAQADNKQLHQSLQDHLLSPAPPKKM